MRRISLRHFFDKYLQAPCDGRFSIGIMFRSRQSKARLNSTDKAGLEAICFVLRLFLAKLFSRMLLSLLQKNLYINLQILYIQKPSLGIDLIVKSMKSVNEASIWKSYNSLLLF